MSESDLRATFKREMSPYGWPIRIEDGCGRGVPDVHYAFRLRAAPYACWVELKYLDAWPKRERTTVNLRKLTVDQVRWQERYHEIYPGRVYTLLQVGSSEFFLLSPSTVRDLYERRLNRVGLMAAATVYHYDGFPTIKLLEAMAHGRR